MQVTACGFVRVACTCRDTFYVVLQVNGDVFLGRYMDNEEDFERMLCSCRPLFLTISMLYSVAAGQW
jgi:hypothetical protein